MSDMPLHDKVTVEGLNGEVGIYKYTILVRAVRVEGRFAVQTRNGVEVCEDGWIVLDRDGYPYPVNKDEFDKFYYSRL